jgi:serine/threonine-protein kinase
MEPGKTSAFGRYEILTELGRGAMGVVYKAYDPKINRFVAIKTIFLATSDPADEQSSRARFFREAEAAGRLSHPRIVPIFDIGEDANTPYIVMEYVAGRSLEDILPAKGSGLPLQATLQVIQEVAEALDYAHGQGVVHRDVKPANILIGEDGHAKIADFGIAQLNVSDVGRSGRTWGTPAYMSPEQILGEQVDGRSDLFSVGVMLYTLLTGHRPFQGNSAHTISVRIVNGEPLPATVFNVNLTPELDRIIARAMAKDPAERYQTGREMARDLQRLRDDSGARVATSERPKTPAPQPAETTGRSYTSLLRVTEASLSRSRNTVNDQVNSAALVQFDQPWQQMGIAYLGLGALALAFSGLWWAIPTPERVEIALPRSAPTVSTASLVSFEVAEEGVTNIPAVDVPRKNRSRKIEEPGSVPKASQDQTESCQLGIAVQHHFVTADLSVWIDDAATYSHSLRGAIRKRVVLFGGVEGYLSDVVQLTPGDHRIRVRVVSADSSYDESSMISGSFSAGSEKLLAVDFDKHNRRMHLAFADEKSF